MKILDDETIDSIIRASRVKDPTPQQANEMEVELSRPLKEMSVNVTALFNAFNMIKTYSENILNIQTTEAVRRKRDLKENTLEKFYEPVKPSTGGKELPPVIKGLITLSNKLKNESFIKESSLLSKLTSGSAIAALGTAIAGGLAGYAGYQWLQGDEEAPEPEPTDSKSEYKSPQKKYRPPETPQQEAPDYEGSAAAAVRARPPIQNQDFASRIAESIRQRLPTNLLGPLGQASQDFVSGLGDGNEHLQTPSGNDAVAQAMQFFISQGWTKEQAAGIVGNLQVESGNFAPDVVRGERRGDNGKAVGIAQWHPDRQAIFSQVFNRSLIGASLEQQLKFVQYELGNNEARAGKLLRNAADAAAAAAVIDNAYERSDGKSLAQRQANARALAGRDSFAYQAGWGAGALGRDAKDIVNQTVNQVDDQNLHVPGDIRQYVRLNGNINLQRMNPTVMKRFAAMAMEYFNSTGDKLQINSAWRSQAEQEHLYRTLGPGRAARPGFSRHQTGLAIDIQSVQANRLSTSGLLAKYNFHRPVSGEPWHLEPIEGRNVPRLSEVEENVGNDRIAANATRQASSARNGQDIGDTRWRPRDNNARLVTPAVRVRNSNGAGTPSRSPAPLSSPQQSTPRARSASPASQIRGYYAR